jgi:hypothetical protein
VVAVEQMAPLDKQVELEVMVLLVLVVVAVALEELLVELVVTAVME